MSDTRPLNVKDNLQNLSYSELKEMYQSQALPHIIVSLNVTGDINVSAMIRTSALFGLKEFHVIGRKRFDMRGDVGCSKYIDMQYHVATTGDHNDHLDEEKTCQVLKTLSQTYNIVYVELYKPEFINSQKLPIDQLSNFVRDNFHLNGKPTAFVFGNEALGIPTWLINQVPGFVTEIPQRGVNRCFNVSIAHSIVLWETFRNSMM